MTTDLDRELETAGLNLFQPLRGSDSNKNSVRNEHITSKQQRLPKKNILFSLFSNIIQTEIIKK